jgi:hypothetical protein
MSASPSNQKKIVNTRTARLDSSIQFYLWSHPKFEAGNKPVSTSDLTQKSTRICDCNSSYR